MNDKVLIAAISSIVSALVSGVVMFLLKSNFQQLISNFNTKIDGVRQALFGAEQVLNTKIGNLEEKVQTVSKETTDMRVTIGTINTNVALVAQEQRHLSDSISVISGQKRDRTESFGKVIVKD